MEIKELTTEQPMGHKGIKEEIKKIPRDKWKQKPDISKSMGCSKISSKRKVYSNTDLPQETNQQQNKSTI